MKRLLSLLLVMGMVGCGGKENAGNTVDPSIPITSSRPSRRFMFSSFGWRIQTIVVYLEPVVRSYGV